jgi:hypothetical protein
MGQPIPQPHPAVVLRSRYQHIKALLAVAVVTIAALAGTVVLVATDSDAPSSAHVESVSPNGQYAPTERTVGIGH